MYMTDKEKEEPTKEQKEKIGCCHYPKCEVCGGCHFVISELCKMILCECEDWRDYDEW